MEKEPIKIRLSTAFLLLLITVLICGIVGFYFYHTATINSLKGTESTNKSSATNTPEPKPTEKASPDATSKPSTEPTATATTTPDTTSTPTASPTIDATPEATSPVETVLE